MHLMRTTAAKRRALAGLAVSAVMVGALAACAPGGTETASGTDIEAALEAGGSLTFWSWTPQSEAQVAQFEEAYPNVDVELVNAGTGNDQYTKMQNAIAAGTGGPDVAQVEYYAIPQFALSDSLVDLAQFGFGDLEDDYTASTWGAVTVGDAIYGLPQDSGPIALFYNQRIFDEFDLAVPTTWDEYLAAAEKLHAADPTKYITSDIGDAGFTTTMIWQAAGHPFQAEGDKVTIDLQDPGSKKWADTWNQLLENDLLAPVPGWSDEWFKGLADGTVASLVIGAWMPGVLESSVPEASGDWAVAPVPSYDGNPAGAENGGGGEVVLKQSHNQALAAGFLKWLNNSEESVGTFLAGGGFPSTTSDVTSPEFLGVESEYFGGQKINEVLAAAADAPSTDWDYLPFQVYANSVFGDTVGQAYANKTDLNAGLKAWQDALVKYGNEQGFIVNQ